MHTITNKHCISLVHKGILLSWYSVMFVCLVTGLCSLIGLIYKVLGLEETDKLINNIKACFKAFPFATLVNHFCCAYVFCTAT